MQKEMRVRLCCIDISGDQIVSPYNQEQVSVPDYLPLLRNNDFCGLWAGSQLQYDVRRCKACVFVYRNGFYWTDKNKYYSNLVAWMHC